MKKEHTYFEVIGEDGEIWVTHALLSDAITYINNRRRHWPLRVEKVTREVVWDGRIEE